VLEQRIEFVVAAHRDERRFTDLCREFNISRETGYVWLRRYQAGGVSQVVERSRRPKNSPRRTSNEIEQAIVALRQRWPDWGAPKLHELLAQQNPQWVLSPRTVHRILERHGLIQTRDSHPQAVKRFERESPNELWQMDFKGLSAIQPGDAVGPLSILDDHSRYLLALRRLGSTRLSGVRDTLQQTFEQAGLPEAILVDHGVPWWNTQSPWGWTELGVWIMRQGVRMRFSGIRHPQTQGKVERMHGALQRAVQKRRGDLCDQSWLDAFRQEYNLVRPHQALAMSTPASRWRPSPRPFQPAPREWNYPQHMQVLRLAGEGQLGWQGRRWEISCALRHQLVGLEVIGARAIVYFCRTPLRELDLERHSSFPIPSNVRRSLHC